MIPIFRKIRKKMADDNKPIKYMRYAIGEILLVVIGILIALQVNTWNEARKERIFELKMLGEIEKSIEQDIEYFNMLVDRLMRVDTSSTALIDFIENGTYSEEEFERHAINIGVGYVFEYHYGAYDALKASGVDKILNDSLRSSLIDFYDFVLPRNRKLLSYHTNETSIMKKLDLEWDIFNYSIKSNTMKTRKRIQPTSLKSGYLKNSNFMKYLYLRNRQASNAIYRIKKLVEIANELLIKLKVETKE
jgi:hypothetical protein